MAVAKKVVKRAAKVVEPAKKATPKAAKKPVKRATKKAVANKAPAKRRAAAGSSDGFDPSGYLCNVVPSSGTETDWSFHEALSAGALAAPAAAPPPSVDLRKSWWTIGDQGSTGSCVGWATADGVCRQAFVAAGRIAGNQRLSPRYVWMASKETDELSSRPESFIEEAGTTLKAAVDVARKFGLAMETELPFAVGVNMYLGSENTFYASCAQRKVASYFNLGKNLADWKTWLATNGAILVGLSVDAEFDNAGNTGGLISTFRPNTVRGGHATAIVGYRTDGRFILRNSWTTAWGDNGFGYVSPAYINAGFFNEAYGITL
jgi:hypothetical protein